MTKLRLIPKIGNVLPFRKNKLSTVPRLTPTKLQELAERHDFCRILEAAGVLNPPIIEAFSKKWSEEKEFDASKFDDAVYKEYAADFSKK